MVFPTTPVPIPQSPAGSTSAPWAPPLSGTPTAATATSTASERNAKNMIRGLLASRGLGGLTDWYWSQILADKTEEQIEIEMVEQPVYKARFPGLDELRAKGIAMGEDGYIEFERAATRIGKLLPEGMMTRERIGQFIANNTSIEEVATRVEEGYVRVAQAPPAIRDYFGQMFGPQGDAALAAFMIDESIAEPLLMKQVAAAVIGGTASTFGFDVAKSQALDAAATGVTQGQAQSGFADLAEQRGVFEERVSETTDLTESEGIAATFGLDGAASARERTRRRREQRAADLGGSSMNMATQTGLGGLGASRNP